MVINPEVFLILKHTILSAISAETGGMQTKLRLKSGEV
jgi:hypothetical protein